MRNQPGLKTIALFLLMSFSMNAFNPTIASPSKKAYLIPEKEGTISVMDYGAKGDGKTDDSEAFHAAFAAAAGRQVLLEGKSFAVNLTIVKGNFSIEGQGAKLIPKNPGMPVITIRPEKYIYDLKLSDFEITGVNLTSDGIFITNSSIENGADFITLHNITVKNCRYGLNVEGRSIWNKIYNCKFDWNMGGFRLETHLPCNLWEINATTFNHNRQFGVWIKNNDAGKMGFKNFKFNSCNMEGNGTGAEEGYGGLFSGMEMLALDNVYVEGNKGQKAGYGIKLTGSLGRAFVINSCWIGESQYPLVIDGEKKWGTISNSMIDCTPYKTEADIFINSNWYNNEPKITLTNVMGRVTSKVDSEGNMPMQGIDWVAKVVSNEIDMQYRDWIKILNSETMNVIRSIKGIYPGRRIGIINHTNKNNNITIAAVLMYNNKDFIIPPNEAREFLVDGYPNAGKLRPIQ